VAQRLDERPLAADGLVQQLRWQAAGPFDGLAPEPLEDVPRLTEAGWVCRAHLGPVGIPPVQLRVHQGPDVDTIDRQVLDLALDVGAGQFDTPHHDPAQVDTAEPGAGQVDGAQQRAAEVNALEPGATQIGTNEVSRATTLTPPADGPPPRADDRTESCHRRHEHFIQDGCG